jgi:hypothetical protein
MKKMIDFVTKSNNIPTRLSISFGISTIFMAKMALQKVRRVSFHVTVSHKPPPLCVVVRMGAYGSHSLLIVH